VEAQICRSSLILNFRFEQTPTPPSEARRPASHPNSWGCGAAKIRTAIELADDGAPRSTIAGADKGSPRSVTLLAGKLPQWSRPEIGTPDPARRHLSKGSPPVTCQRTNPRAICFVPHNTDMPTSIVASPSRSFSAIDHRSPPRWRGEKVNFKRLQHVPTSWRATERADLRRRVSKISSRRI
jgi:hypothetical protein